MFFADDVSQFGHWNLEKADTYQTRYTNYFSLRYDFKKPLYASADAGAVTMSSSGSDFYIVKIRGGYMQGYNLTSPTGFAFRMSGGSGSMAGTGQGEAVFDCGFPQPGLIRLLPGGEVPCCNCDMPGTMSKHSISSPNVVGAVATASSSPSSPSLEFARSRRLSLMATTNSWNVFLCSRFVNLAFSAFSVSACSSGTAASASATRLLELARSLSA